MTIVDWMFEHPYLFTFCFMCFCMAVTFFRPILGVVNCSSKKVIANDREDA